jgi:hypothetical protein
MERDEEKKKKVHLPAEGRPGGKRWRLLGMQGTFC